MCFEIGNSVKVSVEVDEKFLKVTGLLSFTSSFYMGCSSHVRIITCMQFLVVEVTKQLIIVLAEAIILIIVEPYINV